MRIEHQNGVCVSKLRVLANLAIQSRFSFFFSWIVIYLCSHNPSVRNGFATDLLEFRRLYLKIHMILLWSVNQDRVWKIQFIYLFVIFIFSNSGVASSKLDDKIKRSTELKDKMIRYQPRYAFREFIYNLSIQFTVWWLVVYDKYRHIHSNR